VRRGTRVGLGVLNQPQTTEDPVRITTVFRRLIGVTRLFVTAVTFEESAVVVAVRPTWRRPRCGQCGARAAGYDRAPTRRWRHLNHGSLRMFLEFQPRRVRCSACGGIRTEQVPWAEHGSYFTRDFEELVAYLAQVTDKTTVTRLMGINWRTVGTIIRRVVARSLDDEHRLDDLRRIGVDEFSYRRFHHYLTVVVDHDRRRVVWAGEGRDSVSLGEFFEELGEERCAKIECLTIDFSAGFQKAARQYLPNAQIVFDRFHVQRLATDAVDEVRREMARRIDGDTEAVRGVRWALLKNPWDLSGTDRLRLAEVERRNKPLFRAYLLKETLAKALDYRQPKRAREALDDWLAWASRSKLKPFVRIARTIRQHKQGVLAYIRSRLTNGFTEGINNRLRMIARRAYGFHSHHALIAMLFLCCGGIQLSPPLP